MMAEKKINPLIEKRAEMAYLAHQDAMKPRNRYAWDHITESSKDPWRAVARVLTP